MNSFLLIGAFLAFFQGIAFCIEYSKERNLKIYFLFALQALICGIMLDAYIVGYN